MHATNSGSRKMLAAAAAITLSAAIAGCEGQAREAGGAEFRKPVDLVVPFGPGGGADQVARAAGTVIGEKIGVDVPAINVPGATGGSGTVRMLESRPGEAMSVLIQDTLATVSGGRASFDFEEIRAVCRLQSMPSALMVRKGTFDDWEDLAAAAREDPGTLKVATVGASSVDDIVLAAARKSAGTQFRAVPFSEPSERYAALLGGQVDVLYEQLGDVTSYLDSGDFVPVVLVADEPVEGYEDVPTAADIGLPKDVVLPQFRGLVTNSDASDGTVDALASACEAASKTDKFADFQEKVFASEDSYQGADEFQSFLEEQDRLIATQLRKYGMATEG